jgi:asparagine synthase (glutamine-hydrolysing)
MPREQAMRELQRMIGSMRHETFYVEGTWADEALGIYVGWVERACSSGRNVPLQSESGDNVLVFSGEEFPEPGVAEDLKRRGHVLTSADEYLVHLAEEDAHFPAGLNGQFHGLLVDRRQRKLTLFNDRFSLHRLYFHQAKDAFYFAAEAKSILTLRPELRKVDWRGMAEFVSCGCVLEDRTLFPEIHVLPAGSAWVFKDGALERKQSYFSPQEWEGQARMEPEPFYQEVREIFKRNLPRYFSGSEPIGMSLTGGLDTRTILAWRRPKPHSLPCYTFGGMYRENRDVKVARKVARVCEQPHQVIGVGTEFLARFAHYAERTVYLTDGCTGVNQSPDLYVNEFARQIAPVRMTGNYGDQVLRHMTAFKPSPPTPGLFRAEFLEQIGTAEETYSLVAQGHALTFAAFKQAAWNYHGLLSLESSQLTMRTPYADNELVKALYRAPKSALGNNVLRERLIADGDPRLRAIRTDLGFAGGGGRLASALSPRYHRLTMRAEYAYDYGMPQHLARFDHRLSALHLEKIFLGIHKFTHFRSWYRDSLATYVREMLLDPRTLSRPYLVRHKVEDMVESHTRGYGNYTTAIHKILTLEHVHRLFVDAP